MLYELLSVDDINKIWVVFDLEILLFSAVWTKPSKINLNYFRRIG